ncbi:calcium-binding protein [Roseomonas sp. E05]|uniref:calcium-binding protein n=1 Tax=Roseomonas sp. E05 TaxID=3046310 RepID=UPI0024BA4350|nr:calcium-binding protein [Roseomonas sp. E05]MDJ0391687.1 calcium-binding protein [Roseomonas sp. E05]
MASFYGTAKNDVFRFSSHTAADTIYGDGLEDHLGTPGNNRIQAGSGGDTIYAGYGQDTVFGGAGDDLIMGYGAGGLSSGNVDGLASQDGADRLHGGAGQDVIQGGGGGDIIFGDDGDDWLYGGSGNDTLSGGTGNDVIESGRGADTMSGGAGRDIFVFGYGYLSEFGGDANEGRDTLLDFRPGVDRIDLSGYAVNADGVQTTATTDGLLLTFNAIYETGEIKLVGVHQLQAGDIVFA